MYSAYARAATSAIARTAQSIPVMRPRVPIALAPSYRRGRRTLSDICLVEASRSGGDLRSDCSGRKRLAQPGVQVARRVPEVAAGLVVLGPVGDAVGGRDQLLEVGREAHQLPEHRPGGCHELHQARGELALGRLAV